MRRLVQAMARQFPTVYELIGAGAIGYGAWLIYPPAAFIWGGVACFAVSYTVESRRLAASAPTPLRHEPRQNAA